MADSDTPGSPVPELPASIGVTVIPKRPIPVAPYANTTYTHRSNSDVTVVFLRVPLLTDDEARVILANPKQPIEGDYVGSITLPLDTAKDLATRLLKILDVNP